MFISLIFFVWICENQVLIFQTFTLDVIEVKQTNKQTSNNHNLQRDSWNLHWIQKRHVYSMYQPVKLVIGFGVLRWCPWKYKKKYISTKRKHKINNIELRKNEFRKLMLKARMTLQKLQFYTPNFGANSHLCVVHYRQLKA